MAARKEMRPSGRCYTFFHVAQLAPRPRPAGSNFAPPNLVHELLRVRLLLEAVDVNHWPS